MTGAEQGMVERNKARSAVRRAVDAGKLIRPSQCSLCGALDKRRSDGRSAIHAHHHRGYDSPLDVQWLCPKCHFAHDPRVTGVQHGQAVLNSAALKEILASSLTKELAHKFGVNRSTIQRVRRRETWITAALEAQDGSE